jgi:hypothetical protein
MICSICLTYNNERLPVCNGCFRKYLKPEEPKKNERRKTELSSEGIVPQLGKGIQKNEVIPGAARE